MLMGNFDMITMTNINSHVPSVSLHFQKFKIVRIIGVIEQGMSQFVQNPVTQLSQRLSRVIDYSFGARRPVLLVTDLKFKIRIIESKLFNKGFHLPAGLADKSFFRSFGG